MKKVLFLTLMCFPLLTLSAQKNQEGQFEVEMAEVGQPGMLVVRVWCYAKKPKIADNVFKTCAVKGLLFRGVEKSGRMQGRQALVTDGYDANRDYFDEFFKNDYQHFVRIAQNGYVDQDGIIKIKRIYKVAKLVVVSYNDLRNKLEKDNIIKGLNHGF